MDQQVFFVPFFAALFSFHLSLKDASSAAISARSIQSPFNFVLTFMFLRYKNQFIEFIGNIPGFVLIRAVIIIRMIPSAISCAMSRNSKQFFSRKFQQFTISKIFQKPQFSELRKTFDFCFFFKLPGSQTSPVQNKCHEQKFK